MPEDETHRFGGPWTREKLSCLTEYLRQYARIMNQGSRGAFFETWYVDAFAGTGQIGSTEEGGDVAELFNPGELQEKEEVIKGSASVALEIEPAFDGFLFIEREKNRVEQLRNLKEEYPQRADRIHIVEGDANEVLIQWCYESDWERKRAVVFLDPYGMQVEWQLIEAIARTEAIDLWLLFPVGIGVKRLLTRNELPPPIWRDRLTKTFGDESWRDYFYSESRQQSLFDDGEIELERQRTDEEKISRFMIDRLKRVFARVSSQPRMLRNSKGHPLYALCFAASNPRGAETAVKIADHLLTKWNG